MRFPLVRAASALLAASLVLGIFAGTREWSYAAPQQKGRTGSAAQTADSKDAGAAFPSTLLPALPRQAAGRVSYVLDGDTLRLADRRTIRLACIDAPDRAFSAPIKHADQELRTDNIQFSSGAKAAKSQKYIHGMEYQYAKEAYAELKKKALSQTVQILAPKVIKDRNGRLQADALLKDGTSLSAYMVANGLAYVVRDSAFPKEYIEALLALQSKAVSQQRGFWGMLLKLDAARKPWVGNSSTFLFYSSRDMRAQQIKPRLRVYFGTLMDAFLAGFSPASARDFWPKAKAH